MIDMHKIVFKIISVFFACALFALPAQAEQLEPAAQFNKITESYNVDQYKELAVLLLPLAERGFSQAQYSLGLMYYEGLGVSQSDEMAAEWYLKAAEQGDVEAQYRLGDIYEYNLNNSKEAIKWYCEAAKQGHTWAADEIREAVAMSENLKILPKECRIFKKEEQEMIEVDLYEKFLENKLSGSIAISVVVFLVFLLLYIHYIIGMMLFRIAKDIPSSFSESRMFLILGFFIFVFYSGAYNFFFWLNFGYRQELSILYATIMGFSFYWILALVEGKIQEDLKL
jgi:TPR repeat protein